MHLENYGLVIRFFHEQGKPTDIRAFQSWGDLRVEHKGYLPFRIYYHDKCVIAGKIQANYIIIWESPTAQGKYKQYHLSDWTLMTAIKDYIRHLPNQGMWEHLG